MRLKVIETDHRRFKHRVMFKIMPLLMGVDVPDVMKVLTFRSEYFGEGFSSLVQEAMPKQELGNTILPRMS